jgi:mRNA-degrading endonuclease HigB of HigAB toxin-antitoxin module/antitoxin component HigA of HigAB toxin-antitoxin module
VRVISRSAIRDFVAKQTGDRPMAERDLNAWYKLAREADWANFGQMKRTFGSADIVGRCVVFDVGNNRFRLIARVFCETRTLFILKVMDHKEYDKQQWVEECECYAPRPPAKARQKKSRAAQPSGEATMAVKTRGKVPSRSYLDRIKQFPLTRIRDEQHLAEARTVLNRLVMANLDRGSQAYLDALTDLVEKYEDLNVAIPDAPARDVLRLLMESNGLSQNRLAGKVGIPQSTISEILAGAKQMNVNHMVKLSALFGVSPAVFMPKASK